MSSQITSFAWLCIGARAPTKPFCDPVEISWFWSAVRRRLMRKVSLTRRICRVVPTASDASALSGYLPVAPAPLLATGAAPALESDGTLQDTGNGDHRGTQYGRGHNRGQARGSIASMLTIRKCLQMRPVRPSVAIVTAQPGAAPATATSTAALTTQILPPSSSPLGTSMPPGTTSTVTSP